MLNMKRWLDDIDRARENRHRLKLVAANLWTNIVTTAYQAQIEGKVAISVDITKQADTAVKLFWERFDPSMANEDQQGA